MKNEMGWFIAALRKERHLTQKDLADSLHITDKAVSKWERGLSCPDIALLPELASRLGVTVDELLHARRGPEDLVSQQDGMEMQDRITEETAPESRPMRDEMTAAGRQRKIRRLCAVVYSVLLITGAAVCMICDLAIANKLTWSLIPVLSILFAWIISFPVLWLGGQGITATLLALSILTLPYLYLMARLIRSASPYMPVISRKMTAIAIVFIWAVYGIFRVLRQRKKLAAAWSLLLGIPVCIAINYSLAGVLGGTVIGGWDVLTMFLLGAGAVILFRIDHISSQNSGSPDSGIPRG